jgi:hypothetical protein
LNQQADSAVVNLAAATEAGDAQAEDDITP